jgi:hypothetical protein
MYFTSRFPDSAVGTIVAAFVVFGGYRILLEAAREGPEVVKQANKQL